MLNRVHGHWSREIFVHSSSCFVWGDIGCHEFWNVALLKSSLRFAQAQLWFMIWLQQHLCSDRTCSHAFLQASSFWKLIPGRCFLRKLICHYQKRILSFTLSLPLLDILFYLDQIRFHIFNPLLFPFFLLHFCLLSIEKQFLLFGDSNSRIILTSESIWRTFPCESFSRMLRTHHLRYQHPLLYQLFSLLKTCIQIWLISKDAILFLWKHWLS